MLLFVMALIQGLFFALPASIVPVYYTIIRPAAYMILLAFALFRLGIDLGYSRRKKRENAALLSGALIYAVILLVAVSAASFGKNYIMPNASVFFENVWRYIPIAVMSEILRFQIMKNTDNKHKPLMFALIVIVLSFTMSENAFNYPAAVLPPVIALNLFLTYICGSGALIGTASLRSAYALTLVFTPPLPGATRIVLAASLCAAVIAMFLFCGIRAKRQKNGHKYRSSNTRRAIYAAAAVLAVAVFVVFGVGLLPLAPVAVASDSMKGTGADNFIRGDMLIVKKLSVDKAVKTLEVGNIIIFHSVDKDIIHRIIEIKTDFRGKTQYVTKGDGNDEADEEPVYPDRIVGVATFKVPYLGFLSVLLMEFNIP